MTDSRPAGTPLALDVDADADADADSTVTAATAAAVATVACPLERVSVLVARPP